MALSKKTELLSPVGNKEQLYAAIANGADGVYLGLQAFNARIGAENFSTEALKESIDLCHLHGKKIYLTLNVLLNDFEISSAIDLAKQAFEFGIDAIIVQDLGLAIALRKLLPGLELHASTQATCHNSESLIFFEELGFKRVILARENSIEEIAEMKKNSKIELECFVHGAMCVAYSGQCFASSVSFKRSGNRGRCAQNCRMFYDLESNGKRLDSGYMVSPRDLFALPFLQKLIDAGISSFKIEGRKKSTEYVAIATRVYRKAIDGLKVSDDDLKMLRIAYNREFSPGYFFGKNNELIKKDYPGKIGISVAKVLLGGSDKIKVQLLEPLRAWDKLSHKKGDERVDFWARISKNGVEVESAFANEIVELKVPHEVKTGWTLFKVEDKKLTNLAYSSIKNLKKPEISMLAKISQKGFSLKVFDKNCEIEVESDFKPAKAEKIPIGEKIVKEKLSKFGETFFELKEIKIELEPGLMVPFSKLNDLRRNAITAFTEKKLKKFSKKVDEKNFLEQKAAFLNEISSTKPSSSKISIELDSVEKLEQVLPLKPDFVLFLPSPQGQKSAEKIWQICSKNNIGFVYCTNPILKDKELEKTAKSLNQDWLIECNNLGLYHFLSKKGFKLVVGKNLNVFNGVSANFFAKNKNVEWIMPSKELTLKQLGLLRKRTTAILELIAFELPEIMVIESNILSKHPQGKYYLKDRNNWNYLVSIDEFQRTRLFNPTPLNMIPELEKLKEIANILRINLSNISQKDSQSIVSSLQEKLCGGKGFSGMAFTRGSYEKGV